MRLLVVGKLSGQLATAVKMAMSAGAKVSHVETIEAATHALRSGQGADLLMVDYDLDIAGLIAANEDERIRVPVVACGIAADPLRLDNSETLGADSGTIAGIELCNSAPAFLRRRAVTRR